jgi:hypothetical protein
MFVASINGNNVVVTDHYSHGQSRPALDQANQAYTVTSSSVVPGTSMQVTFERPLNTGDNEDIVLYTANTYTWGFA